jgi:hypothetical protein
MPASNRRALEQTKKSIEDYYKISEDRRVIFTQQGDVKPEYIVKNMENFEYLKSFAQNLLQDIASSLNIPEVFLRDKERKELLGTEAMKLMPFETKCKNIQNEIKDGLQKIINLWYSERGKEPPDIEIKLPDIIPKDKIAERTFLKDAYDSQLFSRFDVIQKTYPNLTEDQINEMVERAKIEHDVELTEPANEFTE